MKKKMTPHGLGWQPDLPDVRDYTVETPAVKALLARSKPLQAAGSALPKKIDLAPWCSPIEDQGNLGSCTAQAGVGLLEYFERRAIGRFIDGSRLFLYKTTRNLLGFTGDTGAYLRSTMGSMRLFGVPPEGYWPYDIASFDDEPPAFCYAFAANYQALKYFRLDPNGATPADALDNVKRFLAAGLPSMFGFTVYSSIWSADGDGMIPFPSPGEFVEGGHALVAVGYDDDLRIGSKKGALKIRNSWGSSWGQNGYGWLPYAYVTEGIAMDIWSLVKAEFVDTDLFKLGPDGAGERDEVVQTAQRGARQRV